jgi:hypothetical protein
MSFEAKFVGIFGCWVFIVVTFVMQLRRIDALEDRVEALETQQTCSEAE